MFVGLGDQSVRDGGTKVFVDNRHPFHNAKILNVRRPSKVIWQLPRLKSNTLHAIWIFLIHIRAFLYQIG